MYERKADVQIRHHGGVLATVSKAGFDARTVFRIIETKGIGADLTTALSQWEEEIT
jgi:hypothetical protein